LQLPCDYAVCPVIRLPAAGQVGFHLFRSISSCDLLLSSGDFFFVGFGAAYCSLFDIKALHSSHINPFPIGRWQ
jgi:hypothetical protein